MKIYKYKDYKEYVDIQTSTNKLKINNIWVEEDTIKKIKKLCPAAKVILCHGTRNAAEQKLFSKYYTDSIILGTEISDTALSFPMTIKHDFHEPLPIFNQNCDIIYSNSFDHSYDPSKCLETWANQRSPEANLFIELMISEVDNKSNISDPLEISKEEFKSLCLDIGLKVKNSWILNHKNSEVYHLV